MNWFVGMIAAIPIFLLLLYLAIRLGAVAYYRSKKDFVKDLQKENR